jgi:hypothetical protein
MWPPGLRPARHKAMVWVPAGPEVVIRWLCDPDRRQQARYADVGTWELVEGPTFEPLTSGGLRVRYTTRHSNWTANTEILDEERTDRSFSRRLVVVSSRAGSRSPATTEAQLHVDADEARGGTNLTAQAEAQLLGRGFHNTAYASAMLRLARDMCQRVVTVVQEEFTAQQR